MKYPLFAIVIAVLSMGCKEASFNPSQRVQTSALTLNLYCIGAGETTVLLLPGLSGKSSNWTEVIASQPLNNKVCALDFSPTAALIAGNDVVSAAITALQQEGISENIVLVAHSFGKNKGINGTGTPSECTRRACLGFPPITFTYSVCDLVKF